MSAASQHVVVEGRPRTSRVLIVGAGLTGALTAALLRRRWQQRFEKQPAVTPELELSVWERASYPAGRFGAVLEHGEHVVDMGAQVLTVADARHHNASHGGHGIPGPLTL